MGIGFCVGVLRRYAENDEHELRLRAEIDLLLQKLGEPPYGDDAALQREAHANIRTTDHSGTTMFGKATGPFEHTYGRHPLVGDADVLLPRKLPGLVQGQVARYGPLEVAWQEWLLVGRLLRVLGPEDQDVTVDVAAKLANDEPLTDDYDDKDSDLIDARTAWFVFFEGLRVARERGHALRIM